MDIEFYLPLRYNSETKQFHAEMYKNMAQNVFWDMESEESVADALTQIQNSRVYLSNEIFSHIGNPDIHANSLQLQNTLLAFSELLQHTENNDIHVLAADKTAWYRGGAVADEALGLALSLLAKAVSNEMRIAQVEDSIFNDIVDNPFTVGFDNLLGVSMMRGVFNSMLQRIEC